MTDEDKLQQHMEDLKDLLTGSTYVRDVVKCLDGFCISIQASNAHRSTLDESGSKFTHVEVGHPTEEEPSLTPFKEEGYNIYNYVPVGVVSNILKKHGGVTQGKPPYGVEFEQLKTNFWDEIKTPLICGCEIGDEEVLKAKESLINSESNSLIIPHIRSPLIIGDCRYPICDAVYWNPKFRKNQKEMKND